MLPLNVDIDIFFHIESYYYITSDLFNAQFYDMEKMFVFLLLPIDGNIWTRVDGAEGCNPQKNILGPIREKKASLMLT